MPSDGTGKVGRGSGLAGDRSMTLSLKRPNGSLGEAIGMEM